MGRPSHGASLAPSWANVVAGQVSLRDAVRRELALTDPASGKVDVLGAESRPARDHWTGFGGILSTWVNARRLRTL